MCYTYRKLKGNGGNIFKEAVAKNVIKFMRQDDDDEILLLAKNVTSFLA